MELHTVVCLMTHELHTVMYLMTHELHTVIYLMTRPANASEEKRRFQKVTKQGGGGIRGRNFVLGGGGIRGRGFIYTIYIYNLPML